MWNILGLLLHPFAGLEYPGRTATRYGGVGLREAFMGLDDDGMGSRKGKDGRDA